MSDICDPVIARGRVLEACAKYGDAAEEVDEVVAEIKDVLDTVERVAVPMLANSTIDDVEAAVATIVRERDMQPVAAIAYCLTHHAKMSYLRKLMDERDKSSGDP